MPELPEVQTTVQGLQILVNNEITKIKIYSTKLRYKIPKNIPKTLKNNKIAKIFRIGKYIIVNLKDNNSLIFHLGMSGRLRIIKSSKFVRKKHDHFILTTKNLAGGVWELETDANANDQLNLFLFFFEIYLFLMKFHYKFEDH